jgi:hypothetical protein
MKSIATLLRSFAKAVTNLLDQPDSDHITSKFIGLL